MYFRLGFNVNIKKSKNVIVMVIVTSCEFYQTLDIRDPLTQTLGSFIGKICGICLKCVTLG